MTFPQSIRAGDFIQWNIPASQDYYGKLYKQSRLVGCVLFKNKIQGQLDLRLVVLHIMMVLNLRLPVMLRQHLRLVIGITKQLQINQGRKSKQYIQEALKF